MYSHAHLILTHPLIRLTLSTSILTTYPIEYLHTILLYIAALTLHTSYPTSATVCESTVQQHQPCYQQQQYTHPSDCS